MEKLEYFIFNYWGKKEKKKEENLEIHLKPLNMLIKLNSFFFSFFFFSESKINLTFATNYYGSDVIQFTCRSNAFLMDRVLNVLDRSQIKFIVTCP